MKCCLLSGYLVPLFFFPLLLSSFVNWWFFIMVCFDSLLFIFCVSSVGFWSVVIIRATEKWYISSVQSLSCVQLFETPWTAACQASLSITNSQSLLKLMSIESVIPSNHPTISSAVVPFSSCLQSFPASGSFPVSWFFASGGQSVGIWASASVFPMNIQDWCPLGWTGWISLQSKGLSGVFSQFKSINSLEFSFLYIYHSAAAAAKSLQSCPTLCDPIDRSPRGSSVPEILQARTLEWVAISFSNAWKWKVKVKSLSHARLLATPWTAAHQAPPSMGFSRQEYWSGVPL